MQTVLVTGAAGGIGTRLRKLLDGVYPRIRWSDIRAPADLASDPSFVQADLADLAQVEGIVDGVDGIVHLGGESVEQSWDRILNANIIGCYNLFEAAPQEGRACGFRLVEPRGRILPEAASHRRELSSASGLALWREQSLRRSHRCALRL
jgi:dTDP-D-glucose 4,6-dehydratase